MGKAIFGRMHLLLAVILALGSPAITLTAQPLLPLPAQIEVVGEISAIAVQADGKVVVGGSFTSINGVARRNIGRLNIDGSVDANWDPGIGGGFGEVFALSVTSDAIVVGGSFTTMGGKARNYLAAVGITDGLATSWDPQATYYVDVLALAGNTVIVGGRFGSIGGQSRSGLAAVDVATWQVTPWNPAPNGVIEAVASDGGVIYVGGTFNSIGGQARNRLAALDATTAAALPWNPGVDGHVLSLAVSGNIVYAGGNFYSAGGQSRRHLAAIDAASGTATPWNPDPDDRVYAILPAGGQVYVGGNFTTIGGQTRQSLASLDPVSGLAKAWDPGGDGGVHALALSGNALYIGGSFGKLAGARRAGVAAIDIPSNLVRPLPRAIGSSFSGSRAAVRTSVVDAQGRLIVGGRFDVADGYPRRSLVRYLADGSVDASWEPDTDDEVAALAVSGNMVYVAGNFFRAGGQQRYSLASFDATTGQVTAWNPDPNGRITAMAAANNKIYVAGSFAFIGGGQPRDGFAVLDGATGQALPFSTSTRDVYSMVASGNTVYVGGTFAIDAVTDSMTGWHPDPINVVLSTAVSGSTVYLGGTFTYVGGVPRKQIAAVDAATGHLTNWNPGSDQGVSALAVDGNVVYVGSYSGSAGVASRIVGLDAVTGALAPNFDHALSGGGYPQTLSIWGNRLFAGGYFLAIDGQTRWLAAALAVPGLPPVPVSVIEYYHAPFDHYFITPVAAEIAMLDAHTPPFQDWSRTGKSFNAYANASAPAGSAAICRFFNDHFAPKSSHFYAAHGYGCEATLAQFPDWRLEDDKLFNAMLPSAAGACPAGTVPLYRVYNQGQGGAPNHRFVTTPADVALMVAKGYVSEGVVMCVPP